MYWTHEIYLRHGFPTPKISQNRASTYEEYLNTGDINCLFPGDILLYLDFVDQHDFLMTQLPDDRRMELVFRGANAHCTEQKKLKRK